MGEVWFGRRTMAGATKLVAIKTLARRHADKPEFREMFLDEARLSMQLTNSNIVQVFDVGESDGECYMAMEWIDGLSLSDLTTKLRAQKRTLEPTTAAFIVGELLRALAYAHELDHHGHKAAIVHRDVSPQNLMLSTAGEVKLMDFGIARFSTDETSGMHVK